MFNDEAFSKMKKGARIVNVARGGVIDEAALARALEKGQVAQVTIYPLSFQDTQKCTIFQSSARGLEPRADICSLKCNNRCLGSVG